jgi:hypothetical protein
MDVYRPYAQARPAKKPSDYPLLPTYGDSKAAADYYNKYGRNMPEEWLPTNLTIRKRAMKTGLRQEYKYYYQTRPMSRDELQAIKRDFPPFDNKPARPSSASAEFYAPADTGMYTAAVGRTPIQPAYGPTSFSKPPPIQQMTIPPPQPQYACAIPLPSNGGPSPMMQPLQQQPQRPSSFNRPSASSLSGSDYDSYDSYDDRPPVPSGRKHRKKKPLTTAGKLNELYEGNVLEPIGGAAIAIENFLFRAPSKKKSTSSHRHHSSRRESYSITSSSSASSSASREDEAYERRRRQDLRRSTDTQGNRYRERGQYDNFRRSVYV